MAIFQPTKGQQTNGGAPAETAIGAFVKISGQLSSEGDVRFDGILENGEIKVQGCLTIGDTSKVSAQVNCEKLVLYGTIDGNVTTTGDVEIGASGRLQGDLSAGGNLVIHPGGVFIGKSMMSGRKESANGVTEAGSIKIENEASTEKRRS